MHDSALLQWDTPEKREDLLGILMESCGDMRYFFVTQFTMSKIFPVDLGLHLWTALKNMKKRTCADSACTGELVRSFNT